MRRWRKINLIFGWMLAVWGLLTAQEGQLRWNTFQGGGNSCLAHGAAADGEANSYLVGQSDQGWDGTPVRAFGGGVDAVAACFDPDGTLVWHTFLGGSGNDYGYGITVSGGKVYVCGTSNSSWGTDPVRAYSGDIDGWMAVLDAATGALQQHTFLGASVEDYALGVGVADNQILVTGYSFSSWGTDPVRPYSSGVDSWAAALDGETGALNWHTFLGGTYNEYGREIAFDGGQVFVKGYCTASWGSNPVRGYSGSIDAWAAALDGETGALNWHTFLGGSLDDWGMAISAAGGRVLLAGYSFSSWGSDPVRGYSGSIDAWAAALDDQGNLEWNTFLGGSVADYGYGITVDGDRVYVGGWGYGPWTSGAVRPHSGQGDGWAAALDARGRLCWHTFVGGGSQETAYGIAVGPQGPLYIAGNSHGTWGNPVHPFNDQNTPNVFMAAIDLQALCTVRARVAGGHGTVSPEQQTVAAGGDATVNITPDPGYRVAGILDNDQSMPIASPYVIENVREFHEVVVNFGPDYVLPAIGLTAQRKTERAWVIQKEFGDITVTITEDAENPAPVAQYIMYRSGNGGTVQIAVYTDPGTHTFQDKYLEKDQAYTYQVTAVDGKGSVVALSNEVEI